MTVSARSAGPTPDVLQYKLTGGGGLTHEHDYARSQEVEMTVRGVVAGHKFDDKRSKDGDIEATIKEMVIKVDELVELRPIKRARMRGQTSLAVDDVENPDNLPTDELSPEERAELEAGDDVIDADVVEDTAAGHIPPERYERQGDTGSYIDTETGELLSEATVIARLTRDPDIAAAVEPAPAPANGTGPPPPVTPDTPMDADVDWLVARDKHLRSAGPLGDPEAAAHRNAELSAEIRKRLVHQKN